MIVITSSDLAGRTDTELQVLTGEFIKALERAKPFSPEWRFARSTVDNVMRERTRRLRSIAARF